MLLVGTDGGALSIRWTWLPFWLALNPVVKHEIDRELRDAVLLCGVTGSESDLQAMHDWLVRRMCKAFPIFTGLDGLLNSLQQVSVTP